MSTDPVIIWTLEGHREDSAIGHASPMSRLVGGSRDHVLTTMSEAGFRFGRLGYDLVEKRELHRFQAYLYTFYVFRKCRYAIDETYPDRPRFGATRDAETESAISRLRLVAATTLHEPYPRG